MSARLAPAPTPAPHLVPLTLGLLDTVMAVEVSAYTFPWTRGNFIDSLASGYLARALVDDTGRLLGYYVAMAGFEEMHLLNITVAPVHQGQGHARRMLEALYADCAGQGALSLWLEVRESNARARHLYQAAGFREVGRRRDYYPAPAGRREDAILMTLAITPEPPHALD